MTKYKYVLYSIVIALIAVVLLLNLGWGVQTAVAAANAQTNKGMPQAAFNQLSTTAVQTASFLACSVETTGDNIVDFTSADASAVQAAVDQASPGDTLKVAGTCVGVQTRSGLSQTVYISQSVTIQGGYAVSNFLTLSDPIAFPTLLDAGTNGRVVYIPSGNTTVVLDGLTLAHGNGDGGNGGGVFAGNNVIWSLTNSILSENTSGFLGGGIYNAATQFTMTNSTIMSNTTISLGGGLQSAGAAMVDIDNSVIQNNSALVGGGIHLDNNGTINLNGSTVQHNHAITNGGGLANDTNTGTINVTNSTIVSNTADNDGAGIFNNGILVMNNSSIEDNEAVDDGGGLVNHTSGQATIMNSVIENNRVFDPALLQVNRGAGIFNRLSGHVTVMSSTVQYNSSVANGGGIWNEGDFNLVSSTILSNTSDSNGGGLANSGVLTITASHVLSNSSPTNAGGLFNLGVTSISDSTFAFNKANDGGAIYSTGLTPTLSIARSTFHDNHAEGIDTNRGGGLFINTGRLSLVNSTLSQNTAEDEGSALVNNSFSDLTHVTVVSNTTVGAGPGAALFNFTNVGAVITLTNTAVAYHSGGLDVDCAAAPGTVVDNGYNLVEDGSCLSAGTSFSGDPLLGFLADNGGNTLTHQPLPFSPVIDEIPVLSCGAVDDQMGVARPVDGACDIGSVELAVNFAPVAAADEYTTLEDVSLTVVTATGVLTNDIDPDFGPLTAVISTNATNGTLTLNSDGSFAYVPDADFCGVDSFTYRANDGHVDSNIATATLNVTCVNDDPVAVDDSGTTAEDVTLNVVAPGVLANDTDADGDALTAVLDSDVMSGSLTLNSDGSFDYIPPLNWSGITTFTYHANDGLVDSNTAVVIITITSVNDAPLAVADSYTTTEDVALAVVAPGILTNDSDVEGDALTAVLDSDVMSGSLTLNSDGSFDYIPPLDWSGVTTFTYHANDGLVDSNTAVVTLTVTSVNDAPLAVADSYTTTEDVALAVVAPGILTNDSDVEGDALTAVLDSSVISGTLIFTADGSFDYIPNVDFCGTDSFTYHANDSQADSTTVSVTLDVACVPDLPVAIDDVYATAEDTLLTVAAPGVLGNDSDADGDPLTAVLDTTVITGTLIFTADGSFSFTPLPGWSGITTFTYHVEAGGDSSNPALVRLVVGDVNDAPVAEDDSETTAEDVTLNVVAPGVLANDTDEDGDALTAVLDTDVMSGTLTLNSDGSFGYTPPLNWSGVTTFTYHANDGLFDSNTAVVTITITSVNDAPVAVADSYMTDEDVALAIVAPGVLSNDTDVEGDSLTAVLGTATTNGSLTLNSDGSFDYAPDANFCGTDSFTYHANDGQADSNTATVTLNVTCVNDAPLAVDDSYTVDENSSDNVLDVLVSDSDIDGDSLTIVSVSSAGNGTAVISGATILYTPDPDFVGSDTFTYTITDGQLEATATVTITVMPIETGFIIYLPFVTKP